MEKSEIEAQLLTLTLTEAKILYFKCDDFDYERIAAQFNYGSDWVQLRATEMYIKLGFPKEMSPRERKKVLKEKYCKVLTEMWDNQQPWPPEKKEPDPPASWLLVVQQEAKFEEEEKRLALRPQVEIIDPKKTYLPLDPKGPHGPGPDKPKRPWGLYAIILILLIALVYFIGRKPVPLSPQPTQTPLPTYTLFPTSTVPAIALLATDTLEPTSTPTLPPTDTPTQTLTPRPTEDILFQDDFNNGLSPAWTIVSGEPLIVNGSLSALGQTPLIISIGDSSWKNYSIEMSIPRLCDPIIGVRAKDINNMMVLKSSRAARLQWVTVNNGVSKFIGDESLITGDSAIIDIIVDGNHFNWVGHVDMVLSGYDQGGVVLEFTCMSMDNFKVVKLP